MFTQENIQLSLLQQRAFNLRWAEQPEGVIPLTAADPDFPCAPEISEAIERFSRDRYFSYVPAEGYQFSGKLQPDIFRIKERRMPVRNIFCR